MSKVKITGHASGSGTLTLSAPNTSSDRTVTMPDATGTMLMTDGSGASLTALNGTQVTSGTVPAARLPAGSVLQVVSYGSSSGPSRTTFSSTATWTATNLTLAITPSATSSKVLALVTQPARVIGSTPIRGALKLVRGSTDVWNQGEFEEHMHVRNAADEHDTLIHFSYLDSPSTTSATTYTVHAVMNTGTSMIVFEGNYGAHITLMEIAG